MPNDIFTLPSNVALIAEAQKILAEQKKDPKGMTDAERKQFLIDSHRDPVKANAIAKARLEVVNITMNPALVTKEFFQVIPLDDNEHSVLIQTKTNEEYEVTQVNQHAMQPTKTWAPPNTPNAYQPYPIQTDRVEYPVNDIYQGRITEALDNVNRDVNFAMANKIDYDCWNALTSIYGTFPSGTYDLHSRIIAGNIPTSNEVDDSSEGSFTLQAMKDALKYFELMGKTLRMIYMSPQDKTDIWDWASLVSGLTGVAPTAPKDTVTDEVRNEILRTGAVFQLFGQNFGIKTVNTLDTGYVYFMSTEPCGRLYTKPSQSDMRHWTEDEMYKFDNKRGFEAVQNYEVIKPLIPAFLYPNTMRVKITA